MGATNPKFAKSVRKPKKTKHIAQFLNGDKKENFSGSKYKRELGAYSFEKKKIKVVSQT